jgi:ribose transport system substrate-binding protein
MADLYKGTFATPPTSAPAPAKGKTVWWISCGQTVPSCASAAASAGAAAKALGMNFHVADTKLGVANGYNEAVNTALAGHPDAIIIHGVDCGVARQPLETAHKEGILIMGLEDLDCSAVGEPDLFNVEMKYNQSMLTNDDFWTYFGKIAADYIINKSGDHAKIINNFHDIPLGVLLNKGFTEELKKCSGCQIVDTVKFTSPDLVPNGAWITEFRTALTQHPDATAAYFPWDFMMASLGGAQAVKVSGHPLTVFGGEGTSDSLDLIPRGDVTADPASRSVTWLGYAAIDEINRAFHHQPTVPEGLGFTTVDKTHNLPPTGQGYTPAYDFQAAYKKAWSSAS